MPRSKRAAASEGHPPCPGQDYRRAIAREVGDVVDRVVSWLPTLSVNHHRLRAPIHQIGATAPLPLPRDFLACRHLMPGCGNLALLVRARVKSFSDRGKVRTGIGEKIVNAVFRQGLSEKFRLRWVRACLSGWWTLPTYKFPLVVPLCSD